MYPSIMYSSRTTSGYIACSTFPRLQHKSKILVESYGNHLCTLATGFFISITKYQPCSSKCASNTSIVNDNNDKRMIEAKRSDFFLFMLAGFILKKGRIEIQPL